MPPISGEAAATWSGVVKVEGYSLTTGLLGVGNCLNSDVFAVGGHGWRVEYYPDGYTQTSADWISFRLRHDRRPDDDIDEEDVNVEAEFVFSLLDQAGSPVPAYTAASGVCTFSGEHPSQGFERFIRTTELETSPCLRSDDDSFSVRCCVTVHKFKGDDDDARVSMITEFPARTNYYNLAMEEEEEAMMVFEVVDKKMMEKHMTEHVARTLLVGMDDIYSALGVEDDGSRSQGTTATWKRC